MAKFKVVVSDPDSGTSSLVEVEDNRSVPFIGRRIGEVIDGTVVGLSGHQVQITGGCDKAGFPMRPDVHGGVKLRLLLAGGVGYRVKEKGSRRRKTVRGNTITDEISLINMKIIEKPRTRKEKKPKISPKKE